MMTKWLSKSIVILLCAAAAVVVWRSAAGAEEEGTTLRILHDRLQQNIQAEEQLKEEIRHALHLASRPHSAYLLYQKSLGLQEKRGALRRLREERHAIMREIMERGDNQRNRPFLLPVRGESPEAGRIYSGTPLLAYYERSTMGGTPIPRITPAWKWAFRVATAALLVAAFSLPPLAAYRYRRHQRPTGERVRIFPIFTVQQPDGRRTLLQMPFPGGEMHHAKGRA